MSKVASAWASSSRKDSTTASFSTSLTYSSYGCGPRRRAIRRRACAVSSSPCSSSTSAWASARSDSRPTGAQRAPSHRVADGQAARSRATCRPPGAPPQAAVTARRDGHSQRTAPLSAVEPQVAAGLRPAADEQAAGLRTVDGLAVHAGQGAVLQAAAHDPAAGEAAVPVVAAEDALEAAVAVDVLAEEDLLAAPAAAVDAAHVADRLALGVGDHADEAAAAVLDLVPAAAQGAVCARI